MRHASLVLHDVSFTYETKTVALFEGLQLGIGWGWTGVIGANGAGKTTLLRLCVGELEPLQGRITIPGTAVYCPQRTDDPPPRLTDLLTATDPAGCRLRGRLGLAPDWLDRWKTLSHGERKRAQIGVALWQQPDLLAVDEPTNHLDREAREVLSEALAAYRGIGLLVSHDRELLDQLCQHCLFVDPPGATLRPGGYTQAFASRQQEDVAVRRRHDRASSNRRKLEREAARRRAAAQHADRRRSKRGIADRDHDAKSKIDAARVSGKDATAGRLLRQIDGRLRQARREQAEIKVRKVHELGIWLPGARSPRKSVVHLPGGALALGEGGWLRYGDLVVHADDRIGLTGPNGTGKSTLIRHLITRLNVAPEHLTYIPQEIDTSRTKEILAAARALPSDMLGHAMMVVSRLNSRPEQLLDSQEPSPGEVRKLLLAMKIAQEPHLIVMDEPTNHLDLPSIECLESALADCPCALLLVSHDRRFLDCLTRKHWDISAEDGGGREFRLQER